MTIKGAQIVKQSESCIGMQALGTFGFRGEALSSLCAMSKLSIITRTANQSTAMKLVYNSNGSLASSEASARAVGTTVAIQGLFQPLAVRHKVEGQLVATPQPVNTILLLTIMRLCLLKSSCY